MQSFEKTKLYIGLLITINYKTKKYQNEIFNRFNIYSHSEINVYLIHNNY